MSTKDKFPGGAYLVFPWSIDRTAAARLIEAVGYAHSDGYETVNLLLSSAGGSLVEAHHLVECLAALPIKLIVWNTSAVQSAANMLFALGIERYATPGSTFFFHQTGFNGVEGQRNSETEIREQLRLIEIADARSAALIAERIGCAPAVVDGWQRDSKTLTDAEAKMAGLVHDVKRPQIPPNALVRQILPSFA